jgi:arylsulfatase A-like enzyme
MRPAALAFLLLAAAPPERPPNFIVIFADDLGYGDVGCFGATEIRTPNLDRMAAEGVRLTQFYSAAPLCTPSRAALLTGRYAIRSGLAYVLFPRSPSGIEEGELTVAEALKSSGYATACVGKWHLGHHPPHLPTRHGFDRYFGIPYSNDMKPTPLLRNEATVEEPAVQETLTERYTQEAIQFIRDCKDKPFFLYMPHTFPHVPLHASDRFKGKSARGLYGDVVETIDWSVGEVLKTLNELGLDERTLVVFTSDNGPWLAKKDHGGTAGPLRSGKGTVFEGGMGEPFIARWKGRLPAGRAIDAPAMTIDLFPTLVSLSGAKLSADRPLDGRDITALLEGRGRRDPELFYYWAGETLRAVRSGKWKLHLRGAGGKGKGGSEPALYDLEADRGESKDLAAQHPEVVKELEALAKAHAEEAKRGAAPVKR